MSRPIVLRNAHPRLRVPRAAVTRAFALLDAGFKILPADLPHLSLSRVRQQALKSQISDPRPPSGGLKSKGETRESSIHPVLPPGELSVVFLTDPALAQIHADFMADPTATDVITFEGDPLALGSEALAKETGLAGEICVSADTAARYVGLPPVGRPGSLEGRSPDRPRSAGRPALQLAFAAELTLYLVHGWLHLAGYDDLQPAKKRRMRAAESRAMKLLQAANAIPPFRLR